MAETSTIAIIAEKVSNELFSVFGWDRRPPRDRNWECVTAKHKKATHPSDVVFAYDDPVDHTRIFLTTDLKSYAKNSISIPHVKKALKSLAMSAECAAKSAKWQELYVNPVQNFKVLGLLFVYNHDGGFDRGFNTFLRDVSSASLGIRRSVKLVTLGPKEIEYLITVANDIRCERGDQNLPPCEDCSFFYPDLVRVRVKSNSGKAATIETLSGPWQILRYERGGKQKNQSGYYCYYAGPGQEAAEFKYIFDYLFRHQLVRTGEQISIRMPGGHPNAMVFFEQAKEQYALDFVPVGFNDILARLSTVQFQRINTVVQTFSDIDLGMD